MHQPVVLLNAARGTIAGNPLRSEVEISQFVQRECGAEGWRMADGLLLALRWDRDGNEVIIERFQLEPAT